MEPPEPPETPRALEVTAAEKAFGSTRALRGATFHLGEGEHLALLGPNGAGKTTLLRCVTGRIRADGGCFKLFGEEIGKRNRSGLGVVPQEIAVYPKLTARENLEVFGQIYGVSRQELRERVGWALRWTDLESRADRLARTFSGGMKRRLNIAAGILHRPRVILLDEPTAGVDPQSRARIFEMLEELRRDGASLVLTTHQLGDVEAHCDRIVILDDGQVIAEGTRNELLEQTLGSRRTLSVRVDRVPEQPVAGFAWNERTHRLEAELGDVARDLPRLLRRLETWYLRVLDVEVRSPSLQQVFLKLTGRDLRE